MKEGKRLFLSSTIALLVSHGVFNLLFIVVLSGTGILERQVWILTGAQWQGLALDSVYFPVWENLIWWG